MSPVPQGEPAQGVSASATRSQPGPRVGADVVVHPATGELLLDLDQQPPEVLAEAFALMKVREAELAAWRKLIAAELERRLSMRQRSVWLVGDYEVRHEAGNESVWDADELERVVRELIDEGVISASEVTDLIRHETIVSRTAAKRLQARLTGHAERAVRACCTWRKKPRAALTVTRSQPLIPE